MSRIEFSHVYHRYHETMSSQEDYALKGIHQVLEEGGAYALLGPSGCGKTTLLNITSGLLSPYQGKIFFNDRDVTSLSPEDRNIAQVFQFPIVYDTMTVYDNLAFPLRNRKVDAHKISTSVDEILSILDLTEIKNLRARGLTVDQKQKISLGRGLVRSDVNAVLFDEPLTVIDPHIKWVLRSQLKKFHRRFGFTMVYVTHDQTEALTFADQVIVMHEGEIVQVGTPIDLFLYPRHTFVGYFIGSPGMNIFPAHLPHSRVLLGENKFSCLSRLGSGKNIEFGVRPEHVYFSNNGVCVSIMSVDDIGHRRIVRVLLDDHEIAMVLTDETELPSSPLLSFDLEHVHIYADSWRVDSEV